MKILFLNVTFLLMTFTTAAQLKPTINDSNVTYKDIIYTDELNGMNVLETDTFNSLIQTMLKHKRIQVIEHDDYPKIYLINKDASKFLKVWGGPDIGYGCFFTIGYTKQGRCTDCGTFLGKDSAVDYIVNSDIKLGDNMKQVWSKAHLEYFRKFVFKGIIYFYFEKGVKREVPYTPNQIFYYKFDKNEKLVEIGFGYGMMGANPMLQPE